MTAGTAQGGARVAWYYVQEVTAGTTPTDPEFKALRLTQSSLAMSAN